MPLILHAYRYSVYARIVRLVLFEKAIACDSVEVNPFTLGPDDPYRRLHPFGRVPTLQHDGFVLYEAAAITRYLDRAFPGPALQPADPRALARLDQIVALVDSYGYWPLVRQVFVHGVARPAAGLAGDPGAVRDGLDAAARVLGALEALAPADGHLTGADPGLADFHLGAMLAYFTQLPEADHLLQRHPRLAAWWRRLGARPSLAATDPGLPGQAPGRQGPP